jgi:hypothetical protein
VVTMASPQRAHTLSSSGCKVDQHGAQTVESNACEISWWQRSQCAGNKTEKIESRMGESMALHKGIDDGSWIQALLGSKTTLLKAPEVNRPERIVSPGCEPA